MSQAVETQPTPPNETQNKYRDVRLVIANAFSTNMIRWSDISKICSVDIRFVRITLDVARKLVEFALQNGIQIYSVVGHEALATLLSRLLGINVPFNREFYVMKPNDIILICSILERLPLGADLSLQELEEKYRQGKIQFVLAYNLESIDVGRPLNEFLRDFMRFTLRAIACRDRDWYIVRNELLNIPYTGGEDEEFEDDC